MREGKVGCGKVTTDRRRRPEMESNEGKEQLSHLSPTRKDLSVMHHAYSSKA